MIILALESSALSCGAAVSADGKLISECFMNTGLTHSETLLPLVDTVLKNASLTVNDVDLIAVSTGPGSFTGLRIGVGTAKGLALGAGKKCVGVSTLKALCYNVSAPDILISPIMDAKRGEVYNALYKFKEGKLTEICSMRALPLSDLLSEINEDVIFVGDGVNVFKAQIKEALGEKAHFAPDNLVFERASSVAAAALEEEPVSANDLVPRYIRKSQAERLFDEKAGKTNDSISK